MLDGQLRLQGVTGWAREYRFHPERRWRFDFAFPDQKLAVEIDGGLWLPKGGHTTGAGATRDIEKGTEALLLGWRVYHCTPKDVSSWRAVEVIRRLVKA